MTKFALIRCVNYRGNESIADHFAVNKETAIKTLQLSCPVLLDENGYAKNGIVTYCVAEHFNPYQSNEVRN